MKENVLQILKTKFILHGGFHPGSTSEDNTSFYKEILKDAPQNVKILLVPFAKDPERISASTEKITSEFNKNKEQRYVTIEVANEKEFLHQIKTANVIYFQGGKSIKLLEALKKYSHLEEVLLGKIVAGESAGANVWGKFFYSPHANTIFQGLGILPLKIIPHYKKEYEGKLDSVGVGLETLLLPEYEFKVFINNG